MMDSNNAIEVRNVSKHFKVYYDKGSQLKERVLFRKRNAYENRVVLDNISFSIKKVRQSVLLVRMAVVRVQRLSFLRR